MYSSIEPTNFRAIGPLFMEILHFKELGDTKVWRHKHSLGVHLGNVYGVTLHSTTRDMHVYRVIPQALVAYVVCL